MTEHASNAYREEFMMPVADGVRLRTLIFKPAQTEGPFPVIVKRTCYAASAEGLFRNADETARLGFATVIQFCRGIAGSEGTWTPNIYDRGDGLVLLNWLQAQEWVRCMGYHGHSYLAFTGWILSDALPDKVKSLYLTGYGTDRHVSAYKDGLFRHDILTGWAMGNLGYKIDADYLESCRYRPHVDVDEQVWGHHVDWYRDWITNTDRSAPYWNSDFWDQLRQMPAKLKVPVFIAEGWYDHHLASALTGYAALNPAVAEHSVLRVGAWNHSFKSALDHIYPVLENVDGDESNTSLRWFQETLLEEKLPGKQISCYLMGADKWLEFDQYPFPVTAEKKLYLGSGTLEEQPAENGQQSYQYDPQNPVMSHGGESLFTTWQEVGPQLQPQPGWRQDVLSFVSEPFQEDYDIIGKIACDLYIASSAEDTSFAIKVMEVLPDGRAFNIRNGITTLGYRNGATTRVEYEPNALERIRIETWDVAWRVRAGSRIRLDVTSSNFPEYAVHSNTAGVWSLQDRTVVATQTLHFGAAHPSCLTLPTSQAK